MFSRKGGIIMSEKAPVRIKSLNKAIEILNIIAKNRGTASLTEIAQISGYPPSTVYGILSTLRENGVVEQPPEDGKYCLGKRLFEWGMLVSSVQQAISTAHPVMEEISRKSGESVLLSALDGTEALIIDYVEAYIGLSVAAKPGSRMPLTATSQGKIFLAHMPPSEVRRIIKQVGYKNYTPHTIDNDEKLFQNLTLIREQGYSIEDGEFRIGLRSVSAPIYAIGGNVKYALTMVGMFRRVTSKEFEKAINLVVSAAGRISLSMGYRGDKSKEG